MDLQLAAVALASAFCFALALVLTQFGLRTVTSMAGASISVPTTAAFFLLLSPLTIDLAGWHGRGAVLFILAGLFFPVSVTLLTFAANRLIGPSLTGALGNMTPLFAVAIAVLLLGEVPNHWQYAGLAAVCLGILLLFAGGRRVTPSAPVWVLALPLAAALVRGLVQPVVKLGLEDWPNPFAAVTMGYGVSAIVLATIALARIRQPLALLRRGSLWFVAVGLTNGLAVLTLYQALSLGPVAVVSPLVACYPLFTLLLSRLLLGERGLKPHIVAGIILSVAGIVLLLQS